MHTFRFIFYPILKCDMAEEINTTNILFYPADIAELLVRTRLNFASLSYRNLKYDLSKSIYVFATITFILALFSACNSSDKRPWNYFWVY